MYTYWPRPCRREDRGGLKFVLVLVSVPVQKYRYRNSKCGMASTNDLLHIAHKVEVSTPGITLDV